MRYLHLIFLDEQAAAARSEEVRTRSVAAHAPYIEMLQRNGRYLDSARLQDARSARILRTAAGKPVVTDGPFAESREQLGGFYLLESKDLDQAIDDARRCPAFETVATAIEVRPVLGGGAMASGPHGAEPRFFWGVYETQAQAEDEAGRLAAAAQWATYLDRLRAAGHLLRGDPLAPAGSATTLRRRDGKIVLTDGPFAESREQLGGYCIVRAGELGQAVQLAKESPAAAEHAIEIRAIAQ